MNKDTCFSLYAVEENVGEPRTGLEGQNYHAFLVLVDETPDKSPKIAEELHFVMKIHEVAEDQIPYVHAITKRVDRDFSKLETYGYVGGKPDVMLPVWNKAIEIGLEIGMLEIPFSKATGHKEINCRAGVKAVIDGLGLDYEPVLHGSLVETGTKSNIAGELPAEIFKDDLFI